ncbi:MAG: hypothetical protein V4505_21115 [Pseudomonadota bacterium]
MNAIKTARRFIENVPFSESAKTLARLVLSLESAAPFDLAALYELDLRTFQIAIDILEEWRIDRYYANKAKLLDLSLQISALVAGQDAPAA